MSSSRKSNAAIDPYSLLEVDVSCSEEELQIAYRKKAKLLHPDVAKNQTHQFQSVQQAYQILKDPTKRAEINRRLGIRPSFGNRNLAAEGEKLGAGLGLHHARERSLARRSIRPVFALFGVIGIAASAMYKKLKALFKFNKKQACEILIHSQTTLPDVLGDRVLLIPASIGDEILKISALICQGLTRRHAIASATLIAAEINPKGTSERAYILALKPKGKKLRNSGIYKFSAVPIQSPSSTVFLTWQGEDPFSNAVASLGQAVFP